MLDDRARCIALLARYSAILHRGYSTCAYCSSVFEQLHTSAYDTAAREHTCMSLAMNDIARVCAVCVLIMCSCLGCRSELDSYILRQYCPRCYSVGAHCSCMHSATTPNLRPFHCQQVRRRLRGRLRKPAQKVLRHLLRRLSKSMQQVWRSADG